MVTLVTSTSNYMQPVLVDAATSTGSFFTSTRAAKEEDATVHPTRGEDSGVFAFIRFTRQRRE